MFKNLLLDELRENRDLMKKGDGDSSSGSDDAPSEDNMQPDEIVKVLPVVDKKTKNDLAKLKKVKEKELKEQKSKAKLPQTKDAKPAAVEPVKKLPQPQERKTIVAATKELDRPDIKKDEKEKKPKPVMVDA